MASSGLIRWGAIALMLGGVIWVVLGLSAEEGITDCPTLGEFLAAEAFYGKPQFKTGAEYEQALFRGESASCQPTGLGLLSGAPVFS